MGGARRAGHIALKCFGHGLDRFAVLFDWLFPAFLHLPNSSRPRFVVSLLIVIVFRVVDLLFAVTRGGIVRIDSQNLFVFLEGQIVTGRVVITVGIGQEFFYFLNFFDELRSHRFVEIAGLLQMREQLQGRPAIRIVAIFQDLAHNRFGFDKFAVGDVLLGDFNATFAKTGDRFVMRFGRSDGVRQ